MTCDGSFFADDSPSQFIRWVVIAVFGVLVELLIFGVMVRVFANLQREWQGNTKGIMIFALRLPYVQHLYYVEEKQHSLTQSIDRLIAFAILRTLALQHYLYSTDLPFQRIPVTYWTALELTYSLVTATVPCLIPFMMKLDTSLGALGPDTVLEQSQYDFNSHGGSSSHLRSTKRQYKTRSQDHTRFGNEVSIDILSILSCLMN